MELRTQRTLELCLLALVIIFAALHFVHLRADFPMERWYDTAVYTDEGWWSSAAVMAANTGHWHIPGDYNPAVATPVFPILLFIVFKLCSATSLIIARAVGVGCFLLVLTFGYLISSKLEGRRFALLAALICCVNYYTFAFSRLALLEVPMMVFIMAALWVAVSLPSRPVLSGMLIGLLFATAVLVKLSAGFAVCPIAYMIYAQAPDRKALLKRMAAALGTSGIIVLAFFKLMVARYAADFAAFTRIQETFHPSRSSAIGNLVHTVLHGYTTGLIIYPLAIVGAFLAVVFRRDILKRPLFTASLVWIVAYWAYLFSRNYNPTRYYVVLYWPIVFVLLIFVREAHSFSRRAGLAIAAVVFACVLVNGYRVLDYLAHPSYTFDAMATDIHRQITTRPSRNKLLVGKFSEMIGLVNYVPFICDEYGSLPISAKLSAYDPSYLVTEDPFPKSGRVYDAAIADRYRTKLISTYPVFKPGPRQLKVFLYELDPKDEQGRASSAD